MLRMSPFRCRRTLGIKQAAPGFISDNYDCSLFDSVDALRKRKSQLLKCFLKAGLQSDAV